MNELTCFGAELFACTGALANHFFEQERDSVGASPGGFG